MNTTDFFKEFIAPHVKNIEAEHRHDLPDLDILSSSLIVEKDHAIEIDVRKLPDFVIEKLKKILSERTGFLSFKVELVA